MISVFKYLLHKRKNRISMPTQNGKEKLDKKRERTKILFLRSEFLEEHLRKHK